jgi:CheY-specific phosphatase CheX
MDAHTQTKLDEVLRDCAVALFDAYGIRAGFQGAIESPPQDTELAGSIGLVGAGISGSILVATTAAVLRATGQTDGSRESTCDWVGELANQLAGRLKNQLLRYGVELNVSTPVVIEGKALQVRGARRSSTRFFRLESDHGCIAVGIDMKSAPGLELNLAMDPEPEADTVEGDLLLF